MRRALPAVAVALTLLVVWPASSSAFHEPKRWLFLVAAGLGALLTPPRWRWTALPLVALTALQPWRGAEAGWQALAFAWALAAWPALQPELRQFTRVVGIAGAVVALVVVLQFFGVDLFGVAGPDSGDGRLRLYGTLGNPDFVASVLLPVAVLLLGKATALSPTLSPAGARGSIVLLLFIVPALVLTRSFATLLSALVAAGVVIIHRRGARVGPLLLLCGLLGLGLVGRGLGGTLAGRGYLVSVAAPHVADAPLLGQGLGSTVQEWPAWELSYWQARCADAACVQAHPQGRFAALQDHVHNDGLEWLLERGVLGMLALVLALGAPLLAAWRGNDSLFLAALSAALARALVDFPLHRPADLCLLAALCALSTVGHE